MALWSKRQGLPESYPLIAHLLDTASSATALWDAWLRPGLRTLIETSLGPGARAWVAAAAGLHDLGKANPVFAGQLLANREEPWHRAVRAELEAAGFPLGVQREHREHLRRHERVSALELASAGLDHGDPLSNDWMAASALGHHGRFEVPDESGVRAFRVSAGGPWAHARNEQRREVLTACGLDPDTAPPTASPVVAVLIAGLVVLADRTASESVSIERAQSDLAAGTLDIDEPMRWYERRTGFFTKRLRETLGVVAGFDDARAAITGDFDLRPLQEAAETVGGGLWIAMAPTGTGKTEAALLRHAQRNERLIFALPTQATSNAMMKRIQRVYRGTGTLAELAHRLATVEDFYAENSERRAATSDGGLVPSEFLRNGTARLLAPVSVSTIDQVLTGALRTKWAHLRLLTLANAHVVIDEAHLLDHYQSALAEELMTWWGVTGTRVTLLSATLPRWQRDCFARAYDPSAPSGPIRFPSHEHVPGVAVGIAQSSYTIRVSTTEVRDVDADTVTSHVDWTLRLRAEAPRARLGIVVNTIGRAQAAARTLRERGLDPVVMHSRMTAGHRRDTADRLLADLGAGGPGTGTLVVGTQALEASLDIDLDAMSTDLAPAASLIQRAGRVWRHEDPRRGSRLPSVTELPLTIVRSPGKRGALPYFSSELDRVWAHLAGRSQLRMPEDSQEFVEASALRLDEVTWEEQDELSDYAGRASRAAGIRIRVADFASSFADIDSLARLTGCDVDEEAVARLVEPPAITALLIDPDGESGAPGAWPEDLRALEKVGAHDRSRLRRAMEASVPLNGRLARRVLSAQSGWDPESRVLRGMVPVGIGSVGIGYDPLLGVIDLEAQ